MPLTKFKKHIFDALTAAGVTPEIVASHGGGYPSNHSVEATITGAPASATGRLEGALNGDVWSDLSGTQDLLALVTANGSAMFHVDGKPVQKVRCRLVALTGGASPTVSFRYLGVIQ